MALPDGNQDIAGATVNDPLLTNLTKISGDTTDPGVLNVGETWTYTGSYTVTQADLNNNGGGDGDIDNTATLKAPGLPDKTSSTETPITVTKDYSIVKSVTSVTGGTIDSKVDSAGDVINYRVVVKNDGNQDIAGATVNDPLLTNLTKISGDTTDPGVLNVGETWTYTGSYTVTQADLNNNGGGDGDIDNTATLKAPGLPDKTSSTETPIINTDFGQITPTGTTPQQYINGTAIDFSQYYASPSNPNGAIQYSSNKGKINQTNPGVFFYYTGLSNTIKGFDGPDPGTTPDLMTILIDQSNNRSNINGDAIPANTDSSWNFSTSLNDIKLYKVTDANTNGRIDPGETVTQVQLQSKDVIFGTGLDKGDITIKFTPDAVGSLYVVGVKYDTTSVVGLNLGTSTPMVKYTFNTDVGADGTVEETDLKGITLQYKAPLTLDGTPTVGGAILTQDQLTPVINAAIDYWAAQGVDAQSLNQLKQTDVLIGDLGGTSLGETLGSPDGLIVKIDDDADGYGWSTSLDTVNSNQVDLLSTLTHEFGHILGFDHSEMGEALGVGERHLPLAGENLDLLRQQYPNLFAAPAKF